MYKCKYNLGNEKENPEEISLSQTNTLVYNALATEINVETKWKQMKLYLR